MKRTLNTLILTILLGILLAACPRKPEENANHVFPMASMEGMPADVFGASLTVQQSYQFAAANPDVLQHLPCYCGCGAVGHTSNYDCYDLFPRGADQGLHQPDNPLQEPRSGGGAENEP